MATTSQHRYHCHTCSYSSDKKYNVTRHEKIHVQGGRRKQYQCEYCLQNYATKSSLKEHIDKVCLDNGDRFVCNICGETIKYSRNRTRHLKNVHNMGDETK